MTTETLKRGNKIIQAVMDTYLVEPYSTTVDNYNVYMQAHYMPHLLARLKRSNKFSIQIHDNGHIECVRGKIKLTLTS